MTITTEEAETLERCYAVLDAEEIEECHQEAAEIVAEQFSKEEATELLVPVLAKIMVRNLRAVHGGR
jgi:hypothetical protein